MEKRNTSTKKVYYPTNTFKSNPKEGYFCSKEEVKKYLTDKNISVINALRSTLHDGTESVNYGRPGHISNSINIPSLDMVNSETKLYKPLYELEKIFSKYEVLNKQKVIAYCGGGIAATNIAFVLTALGYENISVYDASLSEWAKINNLPMSVD
jgi:thiosulfate/3-mercaptopyruvate sulfurtransferase